MYVMICDDNNEDRAWVRNGVLGFGAEHGIDIAVEDFASAREFLFKVEDVVHQVDLVYIDIFMTDDNGFKIAGKLRDLGYAGDIVFICESPDYAILAFDYDALGFHVKGQTKDDRFATVLKKAYIRAHERNKQVMVLNCAGESRVVAVDDIKYFEINKRIVTVYFGHDSFEFYSSMTRLEEELAGKGFFRTHKSYLVNSKFIRKMTARGVMLIDGTELPAGQGYVARLKELSAAAAL